MADHLHKQIRDAVKTALTGLTTTATNVYANRLLPLADADMPGLRIYLDNEDAQIETMHQPAVMGRTLTLAVEACAKSASGLDDTLDQIGKEVELALATGISVGGRVLPVYYSGMTFEDELGDRPVGVKRMTFSIPFYTLGDAPDALA